MTIQRTDDFKKNDKLESLLNEINNKLAFAETYIKSDNIEEYPIIFILGPHRSGTTLLMQWLATTGEIAYPTNLMSRFYAAPIIGSQIQLLLTDQRYNFRNEILDFRNDISFNSNNGKTVGALSPNEFWYFWRHFLPFNGKDYLNKNDLSNIAMIKKFKEELIGITNVFNKPFVLKGLICNYNIDLLDKLFKKAIFIYSKRNIITNVESALAARERQFGSIDHWYSFKNPDYSWLKDIKNPIEQTTGQVFCINKTIEESLENVKDEKKITIEYEKFCDNPGYYYSELSTKLAYHGVYITDKYKGINKFNISRERNKELEKQILIYREGIDRILNENL